MDPQLVWNEITGLLACHYTKELPAWQRQELVQALKELIYLIEHGSFLPVPIEVQVHNLIRQELYHNIV